MENGPRIVQEKARKDGGQIPRGQELGRNEPVGVAAREAPSGELRLKDGQIRQDEAEGRDWSVHV